MKCVPYRSCSQPSSVCFWIAVVCMRPCTFVRTVSIVPQRTSDERPRYVMVTRVLSLHRSFVSCRELCLNVTWSPHTTSHHDVTAALRWMCATWPVDACRRLVGRTDGPGFYTGSNVTSSINNFQNCCQFGECKSRLCIHAILKAAAESQLSGSG